MELASRPQIRSSSITTLTYDYLLSVGPQGATWREIFRHLPTGTDESKVIKLLDNGCYRGFFEVCGVRINATGKVAAYRIASKEVFDERRKAEAQRSKAYREKNRKKPPQQPAPTAAAAAAETVTPSFEKAPFPIKKTSIAAALYEVISTLETPPGTFVHEKKITAKLALLRPDSKRATRARTHSTLLDGYHLGYFERDESGQRWRIASKTHFIRMKSKTAEYRARISSMKATNPEESEHDGVSIFVRSEAVAAVAGFLVGVLSVAALSYALSLLM